MLANPKRNQLVRVWYAKAIRDNMPYHGMVGTVALAQASIEMRGEASLVPVPDARDRRRKTWWHHEAEQRRNEVAQ